MVSLWFHGSEILRKGSPPNFESRKPWPLLAWAFNSGLVSSGPKDRRTKKEQSIHKPKHAQMFDPLSKHTYVSEPFRFVSSIFPSIIYKGLENNEPMNTACRIPAIIPWISTNESCLIKYHTPFILALLNDRIQSYSMDFCHHSHDIIFHPPWTKSMPMQQITTKRPSNKSTQIMMTHQNWYCISFKYHGLHWSVCGGRYRGLNIKTCLLISLIIWLDWRFPSCLPFNFPMFLECN